MTISEKAAYHRKGYERVKKRRQRQRESADAAFNVEIPDAPVYKTPQAKGKALKRLMDKLPKSPRKQYEVICTLAISKGIDVRRSSMLHS